MEQLLSGFYGALIATCLSIIYLYFSEKIRLRSEVMLEAVGYSDDIYHLMQTMHQHKINLYSNEIDRMTDEEYRKHNHGLNAFLNSSKVHAKIALTYGEGHVLGDFNQLRTKYIETSRILITTTRAAWVEKDEKQILNTFSAEIEPLRLQFERSLLKYTCVSGVAKTLTRSNFPTFIHFFSSCFKK